MKQLNIAIVGFGFIGRRHASMINNNSFFSLKAIIDIKDKNELNLEGFEQVPFYKSIDNMVSNQTNQIDLIVIATPNGLHEQNALDSIKYGMDVLIEKPISISSKGTNKIIDLSKKYSKKVFCVMQNRYSPPAKWMKEITSRNILGDIYFVQINCFWNRDKRYYKDRLKNGGLATWHGSKELDGGTLFTQFSHFIDLMYWFFGDIKNVKSIIKDFNHNKMTEFEDSGFINFEFSNGGIGQFNFTTSCYEKNLESSITVIAKNGSVKIGGQYMNEVVNCNIKNYVMPKLEPSNPPNDYGSYKGSAANHSLIYDNIKNYYMNDEKMITNVNEQLGVIKIIEKFYSSELL
tara:strand:- start:369 stop:1409 length:1041 start_codon:yes stop_codon:yes gene_type:complete